MTIKISAVVGALQNNNALPIVTVYHGTLDYGDKYVARVYAVERGNSEPINTGCVYAADTLEAVRAEIPPTMVRLDRDPLDELTVVESWI